MKYRYCASLWISHQLAEVIKVADLERDHEIAIVAFERKDRSQSSIPTKDSILYEEDIVLACVRKDLLEYFSSFMYS